MQILHRLTLTELYFSGSNMQVDSVNQAASEALLTVEIISEGEQQQHQQLQLIKDVDDPSRNGIHNPGRC
jgi:hypothetical protein